MRSARRHSGYTLMEVIVATGIFVFLGTALVAFLRQGVSMWRTTEMRGRIYERARAILDAVADDLRAMAVDVEAEGQGFWIRCICDVGPGGTQRLRFVRTLAGETTDPVARHGGEFLARDESTYYDLRGDLAEIEQGLLLAPGGYQEILYQLEPKAGILWRGARAPIGGAETFLLDRNLSPPAATSKAAKAKPDPAADTGSPAAPSPAAEVLQRVAQPLAGGVLAFELRFWAPTTNTWDYTHPALSSAGRRPSGPTAFWDSTRATLNQPASPGRLTWSGKPESLLDPKDDIFPERVEITLVLEGNVEIPSLVEITEDITSSDGRIPLSSTAGLPGDGPFRYVLIDKEWIRYERIEGAVLVVEKSGRGARGTIPARHSAWTPVEVGTSFRRVVEISTFRAPVRQRLDRRGLGARRRR